jgi:hypothetical protein
VWWRNERFRHVERRRLPLSDEIRAILLSALASRKELVDHDVFHGSAERGIQSVQEVYYVAVSP